MEEQELRDQMNQYIETHGVKACWVAKQIGVNGIDTPLLSRWRAAKRDLWESTLADVKDFLQTH
ncbi:hypothetical protein [Desulfitobacterium metallireducens]|uniref:XRE family transcriptional regulator n=1 Tax=Desulfitobacterium metallireducens DSM 15288 TaxID=871968 RepID=W0ECT6_9FIRM|nr:hypothetical protein [Desulfitobacterium metallireducens]AHF08582.1 hypothetical protein DESME_09000 [Desulfitobacterium metallireducens DSM 15288]